MTTVVLKTLSLVENKRDHFCYLSNSPSLQKNHSINLQSAYILLLHLIKKGIFAATQMNIDQKEIEKLFKVHFEALHRYAFTILKDDEAAKDVVQSVFLNLLEKQNILKVEKSPKSYLFKAVYHSCLNEIKYEERRRGRQSQYFEEQQKSNQVSDEKLSKEHIKDKIEKVLALLPNQCRLVFEKSRAEQKKYKEIAEELNISIKTVEAHMSKALKIIRETLRVLIIIFVLLQS